MSERKEQSDIQQTADSSGRYSAALAYVELDRAHRKRSKWSTVFVVALIILVISLAMLGVVGYSYIQGQQKYGRIAENVDMSAVDAPGGPKIDWDALHAINPDTVAWVYMPGTAINYPVVRGGDNEYYLTHDFEGDQGWLATYGAIFMDWRNSPDWSDTAYFIYGHHMNDGTMFADIAGLAEQFRFNEARTVYLFSPMGDFKLRTFSLVHCDADDPLVQISFGSETEFTKYLENMMYRSVVNASGVPPANEITKCFAFATCDNFSAGRYVLYAYVEDATGEAAKVMERGQQIAQPSGIGDVPQNEADEAARAADAPTDEVVYGESEDETGFE